MRYPPAVYQTDEDVQDVTKRGACMIFGGVRYHRGQELYIINGFVSDFWTVTIKSVVTSPIAELTRDQIAPLGYSSRGAVLEALENHFGTTKLGLDFWVTILTW